MIVIRETAVSLRVSSGLNKVHKVLKPFSVADVRGLQAFQAVRRAEDGYSRRLYDWPSAPPRHKCI